MFYHVLLILCFLIKIYESVLFHLMKTGYIASFLKEKQIIKFYRTVPYKFHKVRVPKKPGVI